ncbi:MULTISPECIES: hypothetical protein, partial [Pseudomonas]|uniref:hypothetical protein n=1 Tax=Pseudomonas TaxID=286 RepID=UPI001C49B561
YILSSVYFAKFSEFLVQLQTLDRFTNLSKREANSTALQPAVNSLFHRIRSGDRSTSSTFETVNP